MNKLIAIMAILLVGLWSCKPDEEPDKPKDTGSGINLTVKVLPLFNGQNLNWPDQYITGSGDTLRFERIKFLLSNFTLEKENGDLITIPDAFAYLSLKEGRDSVVLTNIPAGAYKSLSCQVGLDSAVNHSDPSQYALDHPLSPALNEMHWGWAGGYIFNIIEGYFQNKGNTAGFTFHVALKRNARTHRFASSFVVEKHVRALLNLHVNKYFSNVLDFSLKQDGFVSHSGDIDPVMDKFAQNLNGIFELKSIK